LNGGSFAPLALRSSLPAHRFANRAAHDQRENFLISPSSEGRFAEGETGEARSASSEGRSPQEQEQIGRARFADANRARRFGPKPPFIGPPRPLSVELRWSSFVVFTPRCAAHRKRSCVNTCSSLAVFASFVLVACSSNTVINSGGDAGSSGSSSSSSSGAASSSSSSSSGGTSSSSSSSSGSSGDAVPASGLWHYDQTTRPTDTCHIPQIKDPSGDFQIQDGTGGAFTVTPADGTDP